MENAEIRKAASNLSTRIGLLNLMNRIKKDELGEKGFLFTVEQFNYFCNPNKCHGAYKNFTIPKKSGKQRVISAPTKILKSMQTYANRIFQACFVPNEAAMGFIPGRSVVDNASRHTGRNYVYNMDLQDFFTSISQARVWGALQSEPFNFNKDVASALAGLCCMRMENEVSAKTKMYKYVLPQGSPASPMLTNIVCQNLDRRLSGLARRFNVRYSRYADDITFSSDHNVYSADGDFVKELHRIISGQNLTINESKTRLQKRGSRQEVTGLVVCEKANVMRMYTRGLGSLLHIWERYGYAAANESFRAHYSGRTKGNPSMERVIEGKLLYMKMVKGGKDPVFMKLLSRFEVLAATLHHNDGSGIDIRFTKKVSEYECETGDIVRFRVRKDDDGNSISAYALIQHAGECKDVASLTRACQDKVVELTDAGNDEALAALKEKFVISLCDGGSGSFWRIQRCSPSTIAAKVRKMAETTDEAIINMFSLAADGDVSPETDMPDIDDMEALSGNFPPATTKLSTEEVVGQLISSGGDLKILDRWDMTEDS